MHQLGNETDREEAKNKIKEILTARRRFYEAGITLLECDNTFAEKIKHTLETMTFTSKVVNIVGNGGGALPKMCIRDRYKYCLDTPLTAIQVKIDGCIA